MPRIIALLFIVLVSGQSAEPGPVPDWESVIAKLKPHQAYGVHADLLDDIGILDGLVPLEHLKSFRFCCFFIKFLTGILLVIYKTRVQTQSASENIFSTI